MNIRHGDIALIGIKNLLKEAVKTSQKILYQGSSGNDHSFDNGIFYDTNRDNFIVGYLEAHNTILFHTDHGKKIKGQKLRQVKIEDGIYQINRQNEIINNGELRPVID